MWAIPGYRRNSPALRDIGYVLEMLRDVEAHSVVDLGCGSGPASLRLHELGYDVQMLDIAHNCINDEVRAALCGSLRFDLACAWEPIGVRSDAVFCVDVLEHIPTEKVPDVVANLRAIAPHGIANAAMYKDGCGAAIGETLHLTVKPAEWWFSHFPDARCWVRDSDAWMRW